MCVPVYNNILSIHFSPYHTMLCDIINKGDLSEYVLYLALITLIISKITLYPKKCRRLLLFFFDKLNHNLITANTNSQLIKLVRLRLIVQVTPTCACVGRTCVRV